MHREAAMAHDVPVRDHPIVGEVFRTLSHLVDVCVEGEKGYALAAADVRDPALRAFLVGLARQRAEFVIALESVIARLGAAPFIARAPRAPHDDSWLASLGALNLASDEAILRACDRGEQRAKQAYYHAVAVLCQDDVARSIVEPIEYQYSAVVDACDRIDRWLSHHSTPPPPPTMPPGPS
jgi:uncharacterized protein (TIGR02284 family)